MFTVVLPWHNNAPISRHRTLRAAIVAAQKAHDGHGRFCTCQGAVVMDGAEVRANHHTYHRLRAEGMTSVLASFAARGADNA